MQSTTGVEIIGCSPLLLSIRILIPLINSAITSDQCRTLVVYYHNDTAEVATEIFLAAVKLRKPFVSINFVDDSFGSRARLSHTEMGTHLCNIYVMENLNVSFHQHSLIMKLLNHQVTNYYFMVIQENATEGEIDKFFRMLWTKYRMLSVAAFFLGKSIQVYTHFPYKNQFAMKMDELYSANVLQVNKRLHRYFHGKADNLENAKVNAYMTENIPKSFRLPSKYRRRGGSFYFGGRDGYIAKHLESILNVRWQYKTIANKDLRKIINFDVSNGSQSFDMFGNRLDYDDENPPNLEYRPFDARLPISNAYNDCEISFKPWRITTVNRLNDYKGFLVLEKDDSVLLVQNRVNVRANLTGYATVTFSVFLIFIICVMLRRLSRFIAREQHDEIGKILINTWGVLLLTYTNERVQNRSEQILHFSIVIFSMLLAMLASAILLGNILAKETQSGINTLKELAESKLPICISTELNQTRSEWSQGIDERIDKRITVLKEKQLLEMILSRDFNCIYACSKMKVQVLLDTPEVKTDGISAFRLIDDILVPNFISYEIKTNSPLESRLKEVLPIIIEMGYFQQCEKRSFALIRGLIRMNQTQAQSMDAPEVATFTSVTFNKISPYFFLFGFGIVVSILTFVAETVHYKCKQRSGEMFRHSRFQPLKKLTTRSKF